MFRHPTFQIFQDLKNSTTITGEISNCKTPKNLISGDPVMLLTELNPVFKSGRQSCCRLTPATGTRPGKQRLKQARTVAQDPDTMPPSKFVTLLI
jgi:hypothetical protein